MKNPCVALVCAARFESLGGGVPGRPGSGQSTTFGKKRPVKRRFGGGQGSQVDLGWNCLC